jgi:hypothetical protein
LLFSDALNSLFSDASFGLPLGCGSFGFRTAKVEELDLDHYQRLAQKHQALTSWLVPTG